MNDQHTKHRHRRALITGAVITAFLFLFMLITPLREMARSADYASITEMLVFLPGFFIIMGLIEVWLPAKFITHHLGKKSGIAGSAWSILLGSLMIGPLYMAFPLVPMLLKKGVSKYNVTLFIGAWSVFPIGQEIFEIQFMGMKFFILRVVLSLAFVVLTSGLIAKYVVKEKA